MNPKAETLVHRVTVIGEHSKRPLQARMPKQQFRKYDFIELGIFWD